MRQTAAGRAQPDRLLARLADNERVLLEAHRVVTDALARETHTHDVGPAIAPAEAWLLDNFHLIEQQIGLARRHLPCDYSRQLPQLADGHLAGYPSIYELALELIAHQDGRIDRDNATRFIAAYQTVRALRIGELWAFPIMLRLALLENLRRVAVRIADNRRERQAAIEWAGSLADCAETAPRQLVQVLARFSDANLDLTAVFIEAFYARLQLQGTAMTLVQSWIDHQLLEQGVSAAQLQQSACHADAATQISIANSIASLRFIGAMNWRDFVEQHSVVEQTLREDPAGVYPMQDFTTRDRYRHAVEGLALGSAFDEVAIAQAAIQLAATAIEQVHAADKPAHVGYYLIDQGRPLLERAVNYEAPWRVRLGRIRGNGRLALYVAAIFLLCVLAAAAALAGMDALSGWRILLFAAVGLPAALALTVPLVNLLVAALLPPRLLPRLDLARGIPDAFRTMVVVPALLGSRQEVDDLLEGLEIRYLGNRDANVAFALLTDFHDADAQSMPEDAALLEQARAGIEALNERYAEDGPDLFHLFHRPRSWNPHEKLWMGWERKRGKLEQFNALLRDPRQASAFTGIVGDVALLSQVKYVITLDADTQLPRDSARQLIGSIGHPLNRPRFDEASGRVVEGYAILQPRASSSLTSASRSWFTRLCAGDVGIDPYTREVSDVYQDLFGEGSYIGKGIYDVDVFRQALENRLPENLVLSHDLLEGCYARCGLVTDVDLVEEQPSSFLIEASRRHRWIRGDWQIAGWLLPRVPAVSAHGGARLTYRPNPLSALSRWKIFDNLRRSLVPVTLLALLVLGWLIASPAGYWTMLVVAVLFLPPLFEAVLELRRKPEERGWQQHIELTLRRLPHMLLHSALGLVLLPFDAWLSLDAIARSALRMPFTRSGLLRWHGPDYARRNAGHTLGAYYREMAAAPVAAIAIAGMLAVLRPFELLYCAPLLLLWSASPALMWWLSRPLPAEAAALNEAQRGLLRLLARKTWRYFDDFVGDADNWLPPDNYQDRPAPQIASRTSPTNIGMALLANLAAYDFGYLGLGEMLRRTELLFAAMEKLERYRGHLLNWYDTRSLQPLLPQYVSSVDSGNLLGALVTLQAALEELRTQPVLGQQVFQGLADSVHALEREVSDPQALAQVALLHNLLVPPPPLQPAEAQARLAALHEEAVKLVGLLPAPATSVQEGTLQPESPGVVLGEERYWAERLRTETERLLQELHELLPDPQQFVRMPTLLELVRHEDFAAEGLAPIALVPSSATALEHLRLIDRLEARCRAFADMDFSFLFEPGSSLLSIGYNVSERRLDASCYDLLASEARLASFLLIARGQLPQEHWFALGRLLTSQGGDLGLISWSGSMFEYLMPQLLMPGYPGTLLHQSCETAVARQIEYGQQRGVPWGVSESCYNLTDAQKVYQYRAFGVPGLGFKRGLAEDLVIAPYASALALTVAPREAARNLERLAAQGFLGSHGLYEAIDYTPSRLQPGARHAVVHTFMAHHQGMSLLAFAHALLDAPMQRRFLSDAMVRTSELLLQERVPRKGEALALQPHAAEVSAAAHPPQDEAGSGMRVLADPDTPIPELHLLSNGRYHVMTTNAGGGYSQWRGLAVTRWREDATMDNWGSFVYLRDRQSQRVWSSAYQPTLARPDHYEAIFLQARAEYRRRDHAIETHTEISVSPEDDVELRRIKLTNLSGQVRRIELTSYAEVVLAPHNADLAHRAFSNLFVQTEVLPGREAILCTRRPRNPEENPPWLFHMLLVPEAEILDTSFETDRARFIGRGRTAASPLALTDGHELLSNSAGPVLDPIVAMRRGVVLPGEGSVTAHLITGIAETREAALAILAKYADPNFVGRAFEMAWFHSQEVLRHLGASDFDARVYDHLAASVIYASHLRRAPASMIARNRLGQSGLWRFAISGDLPIVLLRISDQSRAGLVRQVLQAHAYWRMKGLVTDLVILNEDFSGYRAVLHDLIVGLVNASADAQLVDKPGGVFLRRAEELSEEERVLFHSVARVVLNDAVDSLAEQVERLGSRERLPERRKGWRLGSQQRRVATAPDPDWLVPVRQPPVETAKPLVVGERLFFNGYGGFSPDGREYVITLDPGRQTPAPWVNVIASPHIGTVVSEAGSAYTWADNAHEFRLTPFHNDPVSDLPGEAFYLRDEESGQFWSPSPQPARGKTGYTCRHGFGYTVFEHVEAGIASSLALYVAQDAAVKFAVVRLRNQSGRRREMSLTGYWELVLGEWRHASLMHVVTETDAETGALFAANHYGRESARHLVFAQVSEAGRAASGSRTEFIGRNGSLANPAALRRIGLSGKVGAGPDPCAALQAWVTLEEGEEREVVFVFGAAPDAHEARRLIRRYAGVGGARLAWEANLRFWNDTLGAVQVETPDPALDLLANGWLLYQTISCRLWGRSGYYQSGGAYGFRDQLQDTLALLHAAPGLTRAQLLRCAERQFVQGDVQHWWHPPGGQGVRTHFSDDYLWLPHAACRYVRATGDSGVLDQEVAFLEGRPLNPDEEAYFDQPLRSEEVAPLYEHCVRALRHGLRFGVHGLPLIGCGDWNDGMNLVGREGKGESVWLAWFLLDNLRQFAPLAESRGDPEFAELCRSEAEKLRANIEAKAWDGGWYRRAWFDDGIALGSAENEECQIDSISQSWAVISGGGDPARSHQALNAVYHRLVRRDAGLVQLLAPPFDKSGLEPGYIKGYVPGVRENGGQYTHAAIWAAMAFALSGDRDKAWELFGMLNPVQHADRQEAAELYRVEPYVMCADIYASPPHTGRGGWTWYTGAAGWMYRLALETLLGLRLEAGQLHFEPCLPPRWQEYTIRYRYRSALYRIHLVCGAQASRAVAIELDGKGIEPQGEVVLELVDDGREHAVRVQLD